MKTVFLCKKSNSIIFHVVDQRCVRGHYCTFQEQALNSLRDDLFRINLGANLLTRSPLNYSKICWTIFKCFLVHSCNCHTRLTILVAQWQTIVGSRRGLGIDSQWDKFENRTFVNQFRSGVFWVVSRSAYRCSGTYSQYSEFPSLKLGK